MALINLPDHTEQSPIQWDTTKKRHEQTQVAQNYVNETMQAIAASNVVTEPCGNNTATRVTSCDFVDTPNGLTVTHTPIYRDGPDSSTYGAVKEHAVTINNI